MKEMFCGWKESVQELFFVVIDFLIAMTYKADFDQNWRSRMASLKVMNPLDVNARHLNLSWEIFQISYVCSPDERSLKGPRLVNVRET